MPNVDIVSLEGLTYVCLNIKGVIAPLDGQYCIDIDCPHNDICITKRSSP